jgi:predicted  nucleic acid-binding Zn-ribbon protein
VFKEIQLHQEFLDLEHQMRLLDRKLADALHRIRHGSSAELVEQAQREERQLLSELDRLMTRMRAIEGQLLQIQKSATRH